MDLDGADGPAAAEVLASFRSGDPLGASLDLAGSTLTRQRYRLLEVPTAVRLFLDGDDVREPLRNSDGTPLELAGAPQFANLSFTLEEARSGALRFLFSDPDRATAGDITLRLAPAAGSGPATYSLRLEDLGDGRPDLLVGWADSGSAGSPQAFAVVPNLAVRGNQDPSAPQLQALELAGTPSTPTLRVRWTPGSDLESPVSQLRHQWRVTAAGALAPGAWQEISGGAAGGSFELTVADLNAAGLVDALQPGSSLGLELRVLDAGDREARSSGASLRLPALPALETRPGLIGLDGVRLLEGDNLQHRGSDLIPLQLRQRLLAVEPGAAGALAASQIRLLLPDGFSAAGSFLLRRSDGTTTAAPAATAVGGSPGLLAMALSPAELEQLVFQPSREATGRLPLSLEWQQAFATAGVPALTLSQPLELRFRDGGDRIPATASLSESSNPRDLWTLSLPVAAVVVDGIGGRPLDFSAISASLSPINLPGWSERLGAAPAAGDLRMATSSSGGTRQLSVSGSRARALLDNLQILNAEALSGALQLSHTPVQLDAILRQGLPAQGGQPEVLERRSMTPLLAAGKTHRLMVSTTITTTITNTATANPVSSTSSSSNQVLEVSADADPSAAELRNSLSLAGDYAALPFTISVDDSRLLLDWKSGQPQPEGSNVIVNLDGTTTTTRTTSVTLAVLEHSLSDQLPLGMQQLSQALQLDANLAGDGRDLLSLRSDLNGGGGSIERVALLPLQVRSDRDLRIPFSKASGLGDVSLSRVDGAGDAAALSLSLSGGGGGGGGGGGELLLNLPSLPGAPLPRSLSVASIQERNAGGGAFSLIPSQAWAFGVNPEGGDPVIAVRTNGLLINGAAAPAQLWLRWQSLDDGTSRTSGFVAYASAADAAADVGRLALLSAGAGATLVHTPPKGTYQAYRLDFNDSAGNALVGYSRLLFVESGAPEAVIAHLDRSAGIGPDHQLVLPVGLSSAAVAVGGTLPAADASLGVPGALAGNLPGIDIGAPSQSPRWPAGQLWSQVVVPLRGDTMAPGDEELGDARAETGVETFLLRLQGNGAVRPGDLSSSISLVNDDSRLSLAVSLVGAPDPASGDLLLQATLSVSGRALRSSDVDSARVVLLRSGGLDPLGLGTIAFSADGLSGSSTSSQRFSLPKGLQSGSLRIGVDLVDGVQGVSAPFSWVGVGSVAAGWLPSRADIEALQLPAAQVAQGASGSVRLRLDPAVDPSEAQSERTLLQLSADALVSADDLRLSPQAGSQPGLPPEFQSPDLSAAALAEARAIDRWLVVSTAGSGAAATRHTAFYRPALVAGAANRIRGMGLPATLVSAAGSRELELTVLRQGSPDAILLRRRGQAQELVAALEDFSFHAGAAGAVTLQLSLRETLPDAPLGSVLPGSLTLLEQTLLLQVAASPAAPFTAPSANLAAAAGALTFQEGRGLLLLENLSHAAALTALANGSEAAALRLQLQTLGYSGEPDASFGSGLLSLADLGLIPAHGAVDGGGAALEGIRALASSAEPVALRRISLTLGSGGSRRVINAWELRPGPDHQGPLALSLDYGDGRRQDSASLGLMVNNVPDAPRRVPGEEEQLRLSLETGPRGADDLQVINLRSLAVDPDGTSLSFSLAEGSKPPAGVSFDAAAAELRLGSLPFEAVGRHTFTLLASDGNAATAVPLNFEFTIRERNLAPLWNLSQTLLSSQAPAAGWDLISQRWVLDANGDPLRFSLSGGDARPLPAGIRLDGTRLVVDPATPAGTYALRLGASDGPERPLVQALTSLVVPATAVAVPPTLRVEGSSRLAEGTAFGLQLRLDRPAAAELTLRWTLNPRRDSAETLLPSRTGLVRIAAGAEAAPLSLPSRDDDLLLGDQELELVLESLSGAVQLPAEPTTLMLLDNDSPPLLLTSRWLNDRELELLYQPGPAASAGTGLVLSLSDPASAGLFAGASLSDVFLSGWLGERRENGSLELRWSDPLAAAWPGSSAVSLARLRLDRPAAASSPAIRVEASAGEQRLVRWIDSPWQAPLRLPFLAELRARLGGDARGLLVEPGLAGALAADADGGLLILDARALLERRYSADPTFTVRRNGQTIQLDLRELIPAEAGVLRLSDAQWALLPAAARDGSPQHQASQALLLRSGGAGGELSDLSLGGVSAAARTAIQHLSGGADPLFGELAFNISGLTPGSLSGVEITLPQSGLTSPLLLKQDAAGAWLPFAFDPISGTGAIFHDDDGNGSADRVVLWSRDGGRGDRDGLANGVIVDPVVFAGAIPPPTLSIAAALADRAEGSGGSTAFSFTVQRDGDTSGTSSARWAVLGLGTKPAAADDFAGGVLSSGTVVFATGEATRTITVHVEADSNVEADEQFRVTLSEASGAVIDATANTAIGTIRNDDRPTISLAVAPARILENGGAALIYTFSRNGDPADALTVNYSVSGTALAAVDYSGIAITPAICSLNFAAGAATALVTLTPISDSESEPDETVALTLVAGAGYSIGTTAAVVGTIADQEPLITLSLAPTAVTETAAPI